VKEEVLSRAGRYRKVHPEGSSAKDPSPLKVKEDNLNTHSIASLYETFEPKEARRLAERLDIHYTSKHGSWLNMAEIELIIPKRQYLDRQIPDRSTMQTEVAAWERSRNNSTKNCLIIYYTEHPDQAEASLSEAVDVTWY